MLAGEVDSQARRRRDGRDDGHTGDERLLHDLERAAAR
jgi:hypothetical protein